MGERIHRLLGLAAAIVIIGSFLMWRSLRAADPMRGAAAPASASSPRLSPLMPFSTPISDTVRIVGVLADSIVAARDPFVNRALPPVASVASGGATVRPREEEPGAREWRVTTTLLAGARRAALINDQLVYVGDPLPDGSKLTSVERDHVVVTDRKGAAHTVAVAKEGNG
jgi:hypothetical protein